MSDDPQTPSSTHSVNSQPSLRRIRIIGTGHAVPERILTNDDLSKMVEAQAAEVQAKFMGSVDAAMRNAPAGTENAVALVKSAVAAANNAFEGVQKAAKQAANVAESSFQAMAASAEKAAAPKARRAA